MPEAAQGREWVGGSVIGARGCMEEAATPPNDPQRCRVVSTLQVRKWVSERSHLAFWQGPHSCHPVTHPVCVFPKVSPGLTLILGHWP